MRAKSRLTHNKGKTYLKGYGYVEKSFRRSTVLFFGIVMSISTACYLYPFESRASAAGPDFPSAYVRDFEVIPGERVATESATSIVVPSPGLPQHGLDRTSVASSSSEVETYIREVFGADADRAIGVAKCESGLRKNALNDKNRNGTVDHGLFQINSVHTKKRGSAFKTDWQANVRVAKQIFDEQGFRPWVCSKAIGETNYLGVSK